MNDFEVLINSLLLSETKTELIVLGVVVGAICVTAVVFALLEIRKSKSLAKDEKNAE